MMVIQVINLVLSVVGVLVWSIVWKKHKSIDGYALPFIIWLSELAVFYICVLFIDTAPQFINTMSAIIRIQEVIIIVAVGGIFLFDYLINKKG